MNTERWRARCTRPNCTWTTTGSKTWARAAWNRHNAEHRAAAEAERTNRSARYWWRGTPNPTQLRILHRIHAGALGAYQCRVHTEDSSHMVWYPTGLTGREALWWPALVEAELVTACPMWHGGPSLKGIWRLTAAGRAILQEAAA